MAKQSGRGAGFYIAGYDLSGDVSAVNSITGGHAVKEVTAIDKSAVERMLLTRDGSMDISSWFDTAAASQHIAFKALPSTDVLATFATGTALASAVANLMAKQVTYDLDRGEDGSLAAKTNVVGNAYGLDWGKLLTTGKQTIVTAANGTGVDLGIGEMPAALTITANTKANPSVVTASAAHGMATGNSVTITGSNSTPVIDGNWPITWVGATRFSVPVDTSAGAAGTAGAIVRTSTSFGALMYVQCFTHGSNTITIHVEHSADNGSADAFADVAGLTTAALAAQSAGLVIASTSSTAIVKRYARIVTAGAFANAIICVSLVRYPVAAG